MDLRLRRDDAAGPEVIDAWFDSGSMPYASGTIRSSTRRSSGISRPTTSARGVDQTRGWFYSLLAIATGAFDTPAYRNVIVNELVQDAQGQKMSKSRATWSIPGR